MKPFFFSEPLRCWLKHVDIVTLTHRHRDLLFIVQNSEEAQSANFWARVCLHNLARLAREATTVRRVLEALFRYFDNNNMWSPSSGLALCVLLDMQTTFEKSGSSTFFLFNFSENKLSSYPINLLRFFF
jgi:hypothetical protein